MVRAVQDGPTVDWAERHVLRTLPPPGPRGDPSFFPLRSTAGPCPPSPWPHAQPNLVKPRSSSFQCCQLVLLPLHHPHSTALHRTARRCAFEAPSPPMMLPLLPLLASPMLPVPVSPRALAPRGLGLSTRPSRYRRSNRVFYSRNPHCDCGLVQRSGHASPITPDKGRAL